MAETLGRPLRLACFGWVAPEAGSCVTGHYLVLDALLELGHRVDLYGEDGFVNPGELGARPGFRVRYLPERFATRWARRAERPTATRAVFHLLTWRLFVRRLRRSIAAEHAHAGYDALLFLGLPALCRIEGLPVIEWVQGSSWEEARALRRQRELIAALAGHRRYYLYSGFYRVREVARRINQIEADLTICGSNWTRDSLVRRGRVRRRVATLPYPVDVGRFSSPSDRTGGGVRLLHLGRLDPRKRVDLLLDAFRIVRTRIPEAELTVVGRSGLVPAVADLLNAPDLEGSVTYRDAVPASEVPGLLHEADILIQASESENFGSSVAEALMAGVPVIVGPTNGTADYIDGSSRVFTAYTPQAIAEAIVGLKLHLASSTSDERVQRTEWARARFAPDAVARQLAQLITASAGDGRAVAGMAR